MEFSSCLFISSTDRFLQEIVHKWYQELEEFQFRPTEIVCIGRDFQTNLLKIQ